MVWLESFADTLGYQKDEQVCPRRNQACKNVKTMVVIFGHIMRRQDLLEKTTIGKVESTRKRRRPNMRWIDSELPQPAGNKAD